uniref:5'-nucleotidase SurE n=1 Tax=Candidatus Kentrum sp. DK TaxID=2126562 RepID=A0A450SJU6_9GAMM|nr:MAG: 5'-nucleotidase /3'-nucleotidase /exopolyphosphatase [Candidatus Kentron sp. DK]
MGLVRPRYDQVRISRMSPETTIARSIMKILLSNDDGYLAPGLAHLAEGLSPPAELTVIAPDRNRSGIGSAMTFDRPLRVTRAENGFYHVDGTPADCVHLAVTGLFPGNWDMVISGINAGRNLGDDVLYSGTVAAAMEARFLRVPVIAVSLVGLRPTHFETAVRAVRVLQERMANTPHGGMFSDGTVLNVNVPDIAWAQVRGFEVTRLGERERPGDLITTTDPNGAVVHWIGHAGEERDAGPGTDFFALANNKISLTPIHLDRTRHGALSPMADWIGPLERLA